jgi:hypothetical protein
MGQEQVEALVRAAGVEPVLFHGVPLIRCEDGNAVLDEIARRGIKLSGAEGFRLDGGYRVPDMDTILDLSLVDDPARAVEETRSYLAEVGDPDLLIEFIMRL